jgi:hypothetical protein
MGRNLSSCLIRLDTKQSRNGGIGVPIEPLLSSSEEHVHLAFMEEVLYQAKDQVLSSELDELKSRTSFQISITPQITIALFLLSLLLICVRIATGGVKS